jgi:hypothetical protein
MDEGIEQSLRPWFGALAIALVFRYVRNRPVVEQDLTGLFRVEGTVRIEIGTFDGKRVFGK